MSSSRFERQYREQHSNCGGTITSVPEPRIGPVLFCSCAADDPEEWVKFTSMRGGDDGKT